MSSASDDGATVGTPSTPLVIVGAGGFGREVLELVRDINDARATFQLLGFLDDGKVNPHVIERAGVPLLGPSSRIADLGASYVIAIGSGAVRRQIDAGARATRHVAAATLVHPKATLGADVLVGEGAIIGAGSRLTTHVTIGRHAHVNVNCTVGHDVIVEDFATLFPGVHLGGGCVVEEGATVSMGSVVLPGVRIGRGAMVGAGSVVVRDVPADTMVMGPAARPTIQTAHSQDGHDGSTR